MITTRQRQGQETSSPITGIVPRSAAERTAVLRQIVVLGQMVMLVLIPVEFLTLPLNVGLVDILNVVLLPLTWLYLYRARQSIRLPYIGAMWLLLIASLISVFGTLYPGESIVVILKDIYLYIWFVTVAVLFTGLDDHHLRLIMWVWLGVVLLNGVLIVAQFALPNLLQSMNESLKGYGALDPYRPSGLFENANLTAFYQLMAFVPLALLRPPRTVAVLMGTFIVVSIVATGSLGAVAALICGLAVSVIALAAARGRWQLLVKTAALLVAGSLLLEGIFAFWANADPAFQARFQYIFYGRTENSAEGRFGLWDRGLTFFASELPIFGIGPESFKYIDVEVKRTQLHNDLLAFLVERGIAGALGIVLLGALAARKSISVLRMHGRYPERVGPEVVIFLAAITATVIESQTHQVFHARQIWLMVALLEAVLVQMDAIQRDETRAAPGAVSGPAKRKSIGLAMPGSGASTDQLDRSSTLG